MKRLAVSGASEGHRRTTSRLHPINDGNNASGKMRRYMGCFLAHYPGDAVTIEFKYNTSIGKKCAEFAHSVGFLRRLNFRIQLCEAIGREID